MKKIMMTMAAAMMAVTMNAQVYVGGSLGLASHDNGNKTETAFKIMPEVGYCFDENLAVGLTIGYAQGSTAAAWTMSSPNEVLKTFSVAPYLRYTFAKLGPVSLFADGRFEYAHIDNDGAKANAFGVGIVPGLAVTLTPKLSFVSHFAFLGYEQAKADVDGAKAISTVGLDIDNGLSFGLYYNF